MSEVVNRVFDKRDVTVTLAALGGGGPWDSAGNLKSGAKSYTVALPEGTYSITENFRTVNHIPVGGRTNSTPIKRRGATEDAQVQLTVYLSDLTDTAAATLHDILRWLAGYKVTGSYIANNWDSSGDSAAGAADAPVEECGLKMSWQQEGDSSNTGAMWWNYCHLAGAPQVDAGGEPNTVQFTLACSARAGTAAHHGVA